MSKDREYWCCNCMKSFVGDWETEVCPECNSDEILGEDENEHND